MARMGPKLIGFDIVLCGAEHCVRNGTGQALTISMELCAQLLDDNRRLNNYLSRPRRKTAARRKGV